MTTFSDLIQKCLVELRQEPGISVQQYSEDTIAAILQRQFNTFFEHYWWPIYLRHNTWTLNGIDGTVIEDISGELRQWDDIRYIWVGNESTPLSIIPPMFNPLAQTFRGYYGAVAGPKVFRVYPATTTGPVQVAYRQRPQPFLANDEVLLDDDLLVLATCYNYLADDEDSPSAVKKFAEAAGKREAQLREALNKGPVPYSGGAYSPFTQWMTEP